MRTSVFEDLQTRENCSIYILIAYVFFSACPAYDCTKKQKQCFLWVCGNVLFMFSDSGERIRARSSVSGREGTTSGTRLVCVHRSMGPRGSSAADKGQPDFPGRLLSVSLTWQLTTYVGTSFMLPLCTVPLVFMCSCFIFSTHLAHCLRHQE